MDYDPIKHCSGVTVSPLEQDKETILDLQGDIFSDLR